MKYEMIPEINLGILADEIKLQYDVEPAELIEELALSCPYRFYYDEMTQKYWKEAKKETVYKQFLMAASIFEDIFPNWDYVYITRY